MALMAGRGAGKTHAIQSRIKRLTTKLPRFRYMYVTPLSVQGDEVFDEMIADQVFRRYVKSYLKRPYPKIRLKNGSQAWFRSFQRPEGLRSTGEDEICLDESQDDSISEAAVTRILRPMISRRIRADGRRGSLMMAGQFRGFDWRYKKYWLPGQAKIDGKANPDYRSFCCSWRIPSSAGYSYLLPGGPEELAMQRNDCTPQEWEQEWECIPRGNTSAVFPAWEVDALVVDPRVMQGAGLSTGLRELIRGNVCAVDIGKKIDPTSVVVMNASGRIRHVEIFPLGQEHAVSARQACALAAKFDASVVVDATGGGNPGTSTPDKFVDMYRKQCSSFKRSFYSIFWNEINKNRMIDALTLAVQQREIQIPIDHTDLIEQLKAYEFKANPRSKKVQYGSQRSHDDLVAALAMAVEAKSNNWLGTEKYAPAGSY